MNPEPGILCYKWTSFWAVINPIPQEKLATKSRVNWYFLLIAFCRNYCAVLGKPYFQVDFTTVSISYWHQQERCTIFSNCKYLISSSKRGGSSKLPSPSNERCTVLPYYQNKCHPLVSATHQNAMLIRNLTII